MNEVMLQVVGPNGEDLGDEPVPLSQAQTPAVTQSARDLIAKRIEIKAFIEEQQKAFSEYLRPYNEGKQAIDNALLALCQEQGTDTLKARGVGTAYISHPASVKVLDQEAFVEFCCANWREFGSALLMAGAQIDAAKKLQEDGKLPDCLKIDYGTRMNIRKS